MSAQASMDDHVSSAAVKTVTVIGFGRRLVATLVDGWIGQGVKQVVWEPKYRSAGLYFYRIHAKPLGSDSGYSEYRAVRKMMILK